MTTVTEIADTISKEFATAVRQAEANDRSEIETLIEHVHALLQSLEAMRDRKAAPPAVATNVRLLSKVKS